MIKTLTTEEVLAVHKVLTEDFAAADDPISPPGVKSVPLLESAVSRQHTGSGYKLKYDTFYLNAASLTYGICLNHPFHNGNKRTSLVSMLCHLDRNDLVFDESMTHDELYEFMLEVADHGFASSARRSRGDPDNEVKEMAAWIRKRTRRIERRERLCTYRELKTILGRFGFEFDELRDNHIDIVKYVESSSFFGLRTRRDRRRICRMPYPSDGATVSRQVLTKVRESCSLTDLHGVDSTAFFSASRPADYFVASYRGTLRRLARV